MSLRTLENIVKANHLIRGEQYQSVLRDIIEDGDREDLRVYLKMIVEEDSYATFLAVMNVGDRGTIEYVSTLLLDSKDYRDLNMAWTGFMHLGIREKYDEALDRWKKLSAVK